MNTNSSVDLSARLRAERLRLGWTQSDTAARAGISSRNYARFELLGRTSLSQFVKVAAALGLNVELTAAASASIAGDPSAAKPRQRGVRHPKSKAEPGKQSARTTAAKTRASAPAVQESATYRPPKAGEQQPAASAAEIAAITKKYRDSIDRLAAMIVANRLTNSTSTQLARNFMSSDSVPKADQPAYLAAVLSVLSQLTTDNAAAHGCRPEQLEGWKSGWHFDQSIPGALD